MKDEQSTRYRVENTGCKDAHALGGRIDELSENFDKDIKKNRNYKNNQSEKKSKIT